MNKFHSKEIFKPRKAELSVHGSDQQVRSQDCRATELLKAKRLKTQGAVWETRAIISSIGPTTQKASGH